MTRPIESFNALSSLARKMEQDPSRFEAASRDSEIARQEMSELGMEVPQGVEIRLVRQEHDVFHFTIPADPNLELAERDLADTSAGGLSTAGSIGTIPSTLMTISTYARHGPDA